MVKEHVQIIRRMVDEDTGEILHEEQQYYENGARARQADALKEMREAAKRNMNLAEQYGEFVWLKYDLRQQLCPNISPQGLARLMLMGSMKNSDEPFCEEHLNMPLASCSGVIRELSKTQYLGNGRLPADIPDRLIWTGAIDKRKIQEDADRLRYITRMYRGAYREVYGQLKPSSHVYLGYLMRLVPWLNRKYNVLCDNPLEGKLGAIVPLRPPDIAERLDLSKKGIWRIITTWESFTLGSGTLQQPVVRRVRLGTAQAIAINPRFIYAGTDWADVEYIWKFEGGCD